MATSTPTLGSIGDRVDLRIRQGATFGPHEITLSNPDATPVNLTGCTLRGQIRRAVLDDDIVAGLICSVTNATAGKATFGLDAVTTAAIPAGAKSTDPDSQGVWDLELVDAAGRVMPVFYGAVTIIAEVTR